MSLTEKPPKSQSLECLPTSEYVVLVVRFTCGRASALRLRDFFVSSLESVVDDERTWWVAGSCHSSSCSLRVVALDE